MRDIADEMVNIALFLLFGFVLLKNKWHFLLETVMQHPDRLGIAQCQPTVLTSQLPRELVKLLKVTLDRSVGVEQNRKNSLSGAGIIDYLSRKE